MNGGSNKRERGGLVLIDFEIDIEIDHHNDTDASNEESSFLPHHRFSVPGSRDIACFMGLPSCHET